MYQQRESLKTTHQFRVIDTGLRSGRWNVAFDQALVDARAEGTIPDTIRFLRFEPTALVGVHQFLSHEVRQGYCAAHGIELARRITGGGGIYFDEGQLGWELVFDRRTLGVRDLATLTRRICEAASDGLRRLGVPARFRPRNDIEVDGRKISGTGGIFDGDVVFYQGTLLIDFDAADMIAALKVPVSKLAKRDLDSARQRVVTMREVLGSVPDLPTIQAALLSGLADGLGIEPVWGEVSDAELALAQALHTDELGTDEFVYGLDAPEVEDGLVSATLLCPGGALRADVRLEGPNLELVREVLVTGDFFVTPTRLVFDLEASLRGLRTDEVGPAIDAFFAAGDFDLLALTPADFRGVVEAALGQLTFVAGGHRLRGHLIGQPPGEGPTLIFLHDALGCARTWRDVPHKLASATGCGAFVYDRRGSGDSDPLAPPFDPDYLRHEALQTLPGALDAAGVTDAILVGHSDGGTIALAFAAAHPDRVRGVVTLAAHLFRERRTLDTIERYVDEFERGDLAERLARYHGRRVEQTFRRLETVWLGGGLGDWGLTEALPQVGCPVLAIHGAEDEFFSYAQLDALEAAVAGPVRALRLERCGHAPHHQRRRRVRREIVEFVTSLKRHSRVQRIPT